MVTATHNHGIERASSFPAEGGASAYDVVVIGGGASGIAAALSAARAGARVCVIERDVQAGLPILATGNGRCNLSNAKLEPRRYRHPDVVRTVFGSHPERIIAEFFEQAGVLFAEEGEGRLYPVTRRAESVRDVLLGACEREGVELLCCAEVRRVEVDGTGFHALTLSVPAAPLSHKHGRDGKAEVRNARKALAAAERAERTLGARAVVLACGGSSEEPCRIFSAPHLAEEPVLCPIACALDIPLTRLSKGEAALLRLDGLRAEVMLALVRNGATIAFEQGEVLFRPYGVSGIAAFNLSRRIEEGDAIELDLFPHMNERDLAGLLARRVEVLGPFEGDARWFDGLLARPLAELIALAARGTEQPLNYVAALLHRLPLRVSGTAEHAQAQVRRGGIPFGSVDLATLAITCDAQGEPRCGGLFACGEALDMDADCGGFNLAWAWISGMRAGSSAAEYAGGDRKSR